MVSVTVKSSNGEKDEMVARILSNAVEREQAILERGLAKTEAHLHEFEKRYGMSSLDFFKRYRNGETDDRNDFIDWAGEYYIYQSLREQIDCLKGISF